MKAKLMKKKSRSGLRWNETSPNILKKNPKRPTSRVFGDLSGIVQMVERSPKELAYIWAREQNVLCWVWSRGNILGSGITVEENACALRGEISTSGTFASGPSVMQTLITDCLAAESFRADLRGPTEWPGPVPFDNTLSLQELHSSRPHPPWAIDFIQLYLPI